MSDPFFNAACIGALAFGIAMLVFARNPNGPEIEQLKRRIAYLENWTDHDDANRNLESTRAWRAIVAENPDAVPGAREMSGEDAESYNRFLRWARERRRATTGYQTPTEGDGR